jgi:3-methylcrotonyl-CoA carboxylase alpha subunit
MQKHFDELFPTIPEPSAETLAQAGLFVALRDRLPPSHTATSPWTSLVSRRFGGDAYEQTISLQNNDNPSEPVTVLIKSYGTGKFDVTVRTTTDTTTFPSVLAQLISPTTLSTTLNSQSSHTTIVSQPPPPAIPASLSPSTMERLHIFNGGQKTTLVLPSPKWLLSLGGDILNATKGALKAPMPSLVVEVHVAVGDRVKKGQAVVVLESMKTETVLRSESDGIVKAVGCKKGEMVEEGRELVDIDSDETAS